MHFLKFLINYFFFRSLQSLALTERSIGTEHKSTSNPYILESCGTCHFSVTINSPSPSVPSVFYSSLFQPPSADRCTYSCTKSRTERERRTLRYISIVFDKLSHIFSQGGVGMETCSPPKLSLSYSDLLRTGVVFLGNDSYNKHHYLNNLSNRQCGPERQRRVSLLSLVDVTINIIHLSIVFSVCTSFATTEFHVPESPNVLIFGNHIRCATILFLLAFTQYFIFNWRVIARFSGHNRKKYFIQV